MGFWDFLQSHVFRQLVSQLVFAIVACNNHVPFHLLWKKHLTRHLQVPKYYEYGCKFHKWHSWAMVLLILTKYLAWFKFQAKISSHSGVCVQGEWEKYNPPSPSLSKDEGIRNIGHSMSIRNLIFGVKVLRFHIWFVMTVYYIYYKMRQMLLQNATATLLQNASGFLLQNSTVLLQNATVIKKCDVFVYYKLWQYTVS